MTERTGVIVQARMGSTRLPGKVLEPIGDRSMIAWVVDRLRACRLVDLVVVAVPAGTASEPLVEECRRLGARTFEGPDDDVLARYLGAARAFDIDPVVRVTSDCPLIDPEIVDAAVEAFRRRRGAGCELVSNFVPRRWPRGLDVEVVAREALERADTLEADLAVREHVTLAMYRRPDVFRVEGFPSAEDLSTHRWTVDTADDLAFVRAVVGELSGQGALFGYRDVLDLLERRPELMALNASIQQKELPS
jgi:spore coat polysaccharide biosynthesis protein SpsF